MIDKCGREIDYVRISLTDLCNLRCIYCMPENGIRQISHEQILRFEEIVRICRLLASVGIRKIKLTGGEPLVRRNCAGLVKELKAIPGIETVTLTTNGLLLEEQLPALAEAGIDAVNISLDTLDEEEFLQITRRPQLKQVLAGLQAALAWPQLPLKINCVPALQEPDHLAAVAGLAKAHPIHVRFIEMMPIGLGKQFPFQDEAHILEILEKAYGPVTPVEERYGNGPCHYYAVEGFQGKIGFISAMSHKFCHQCNRVRLTSEGYLKACLQYQTGADLRSLLRGGATDEEILQTISDVIWNKPVSHNFYEEKTMQEELHTMSQIGG